MTAWTLILLPRATVMPPMVVDHPGPPPEQLRRHADDPDVDEATTPTVYVHRLTLPGDVAVYTVDDLATGRLAAGIPVDLPRHDHRATVHDLKRATPTRPVTIDGADLAEELAEQLEPTTAQDRRRHRAVIAEDEARMRRAIDEVTPNLAHLEQERVDVDALTAERRRPVPIRPPRAGECQHLIAIDRCPNSCPAPVPRPPGAEEFDADVPTRRIHP